MTMHAANFHQNDHGQTLQYSKSVSRPLSYRILSFPNFELH